MADMAITAANVKKVSGTGATNVSGAATITAGQTIYIDTSQLVQLADGDLSTTAALAVGIALNGGSLGQPITWCGAGSVVTIGATVAPGALYLLSNTAGGILVADSTPPTGNRTMVVGIGNNATDITVLMVTSSNQAAHA